MIDKLKSPKVLATIAAIIVAVWVAITGTRPPDVVEEAIESATGAEVDCDDAGKCSVTEGSEVPVTVPVDSDVGAQGNAELIGRGSGEGSGQ